ncbi:uncharacterized protein LOC123538777 isoform X1 [Mercenaria mercenaria]|uniref:uncharacterized protein LOC123538777 isoform X1 n=1 Tax=Mercenaria mercenaria TaxID=6596 RepID=UPI00234F765E|nr:uncharacterized protein LOC123538777 isoform X1 [Mercenaria mercenaria]
MCIGFWMDFFGDMDDQGLLSTANDLHVECLRFCFNGIIQRELDQIRAEWNTHRVRHSAEHTLEGKPDLLYHYPELFGASDFRYPVAESDIDELELFTTKPPEFGCLDNCAEHFQQLMGNHGKEMPRTCLDAKSLYLWLIQYV